MVIRTTTFKERCQTRDYMFGKYGANLAESSTAVKFSGNQFLHSQQHPNFLPKST